MTSQRRPSRPRIRCTPVPMALGVHKGLISLGPVWICAFVWLCGCMGVRVCVQLYYTGTNQPEFQPPNPNKCRSRPPFPVKGPPPVAINQVGGSPVPCASIWSPRPPLIRSSASVCACVHFSVFLGQWCFYVSRVFTSSCKGPVVLPVLHHYLPHRLSPPCALPHVRSQLATVLMSVI